MFQLVKTLNSHLETGRLEDNTLELVFQTYWPQFEEGLNRILEETKPQKKEAGKAARSDGDLLTEILYTVRSMDQRLKKLNEPKPALAPKEQLLFDFSLEEEPLPVSPELKPGDRILHTTFGAGKVIDISKVGNEWFVVVDFEEVGRKTLVYSFLLKSNLMRKIEPEP